MSNVRINYTEACDEVAKLRLLLSDLLDELKYVYQTYDVADSIKNSDSLRDEVSKALGYYDYKTF